MRHVSVGERTSLRFTPQDRANFALVAASLCDRDPALCTGRAAVFRALLGAAAEKIRAGASGTLA